MFQTYKHLSTVFHNFCLIHVLLFFSAGYLKIIARGWGFNTIFLPQSSGFRTFFVPEGRGFSISKKIRRGLPGGGWSGLELTDTLSLLSIDYNVPVCSGTQKEQHQDSFLTWRSSCSSRVTQNAIAHV